MPSKHLDVPIARNKSNCTPPIARSIQPVLLPPRTLPDEISAVAFSPPQKFPAKFAKRILGGNCTTSVTSSPSSNSLVSGPPTTRHPLPPAAGLVCGLRVYRRRRGRRRRRTRRRGNFRPDSPGCAGSRARSLPRRCRGCTPGKFCTPPSPSVTPVAPLRCALLAPGILVRILNLAGVEAL